MAGEFGRGGKWTKAPPSISLWNREKKSDADRGNFARPRRPPPSVLIRFEAFRGRGGGRTSLRVALLIVIMLMTSRTCNRATLAERQRANRTLAFGEGSLVSWAACLRVRTHLVPRASPAFLSDCIAFHLLTPAQLLAQVLECGS